MKKISILIALVASFTSAIFAQDDIRLPQKTNRPQYVNYSEQEKGFWCAVEVDAGSSVDIHEKNMQVIGGSFTGGYRFSEYVRVGLGLGGRCYVNNNDVRRSETSLFTLPIFANARGNFVSQDNRDIVPYWSFNIGGIVWDGFFFSPTIGLRFGEQRDSWLLGLSYSFNTVNAFHGAKKEANFLMLKIGYEF